MSALAPAATPDDEGFGVHRQIEGIPVVLSGALVRVPSVRGEAENVDVSPLAISITVDADQLAVNERTGVTATVRFPLWARALSWQDGWPALGDADRLWLQACARNFIGETPDAIQRADFVETDADLWTVDQSAYCLKLYEDADTGPLDFFLDPPDGAYSADFEFPMTLPRDGFPPGHEQTLLVHVGLVGVYDDGAGGTEAVFLDDRAGRQMTAGKTINVRVPDPGVEWVEPDGGWQTQHITDAPAMPDVVLTARLSDLPRGEATLAWTYQVEFSYDRREWDGSALEARTGTCTFSETTEVTIDRPVKTVEWTVPFTDETAECRFTNATNPGGDVREEWLYGDDVMIGGAVTPSVTATADGQEYTPETPVPAHSILGLNPDPADVRAGASEHLQVTIYEESAPKWAQFGATGAPIYGPPNGFGLVQMDNPEATDRSLWDWRANREQGREYLEVTIWNLMLGYPERVRTETINRRGPFPGATDFTTDEEQWKYCFQRFNGGHYWIWQPSNPRNPSGPGRWVRNPRLAVWPGHTAPAGTERWDLLVRVQADQFPEGW